MVKSRGYPLSPRANYSPSRFDERSLPSGSATIPHRAWDIMSTPIVTSRRGLGNSSQNHHKYSTHASPPVTVESCRYQLKRRNLRNHQEESGWKERRVKIKIHFMMEAALDVTKVSGWCQLAILLFFLEIGSTQQRKFEILFSHFLRFTWTPSQCIPFKWKMQLEILISVDSQVAI